MNLPDNLAPAMGWCLVGGILTLLLLLTWWLGTDDDFEDLDDD